MIKSFFFNSPRSYRDIWEWQHILFDAMVDLKKGGEQPKIEYLLLLEHLPVITLGKHGKSENLINKEEMILRGIECIRIERGGDITYHGPGQLVVYPILDLEKHKLGVKGFINLLEEAIIRTIATYGIIGERIEGATGVWIDSGTFRERKICAIGVKCSRFITMHGLALNVNTDLEAFRLINPCGFINKGVTSLAKELNHEVEISEVATKFEKIFKNLLAGR